MRARSLLLVPFLFPLSTVGCSSNARPNDPSTTASAPSAAAGAPGTPTKIVSFDLSPENLRVDKIGMRDGQLRPDGAMDLAFTATIDGAVDALFIVECSQKGNPKYGYRADTIQGDAELPHELGGVIDTASMTLGVGIVENGKWDNQENGGLALGPGPHQLTIYAPNTGLMSSGHFLRLYVRAPGGAVVAGPIAQY